MAEQSREPEILKSIIDDTEYNKTPQSRNEEILLSILNDTEYTKTPQSREEELLLELKGKIGHGITVEPLSVTENGTYTAPTGKAYSPVEVTITPPQLVKRVTGNPVEFTDGADAPLVKCTTAIQGNQDLHGYSKPWVGGSGRNKTDQADVIMSAAGYVIGTGSTTEYINADHKVYPSGTYTVSFDLSDAAYPFNCQVALFDGSTNVSDTPTVRMESGGRKYITIIASASFDKWKIYSASSSGGTFANFMVELGSTATSYEPYSNICPITAYDESTISVEDENEVVQQTSTATFTNSIYQGNADFVGGEVTSEKPIAKVSDFTWTYDSTYQRFLSSAVPGIKQVESRRGFVLSDSYEAITDGRPISNVPEFAIYVGGEQIVIHDPRYTSSSDFVTAMGNSEFSYELATPTTETITPTNLPIKSLFGYNHIESSTGDMVIDYITDQYQNFVDTVNRAVPNTRKSGSSAMDVFLSLEQYKE